MATASTAFLHWNKGSSGPGSDLFPARHEDCRVEDVNDSSVDGTALDDERVLARRSFGRVPVDEPDHAIDGHAHPRVASRPPRDDDHLFGNGGKADDVCDGGGCRETGRRCGPGLETSPCLSLGTVRGFGSEAASAARLVPASSQTVLSVETVCSASVALGDTVATTLRQASALTNASRRTRVKALPRNGGGAGVGLSGFENPPLAFHRRTARDARIHLFRAYKLSLISTLSLILCLS